MLFRLPSTSLFLLHSSQLLFPSAASFTRSNPPAPGVLIAAAALISRTAAFATLSSSPPPPRSPLRSIDSPRSLFHSSRRNIMSAAATTVTTTADGDDDPYIYLEEVESERSIAFAKMANERCLSQLGDPSHTDTYRRVLAALESDDRQVILCFITEYLFESI